MGGIEEVDRILQHGDELPRIVQINPEFTVIHQDLDGVVRELAKISLQLEAVRLYSLADLVEIGKRRLEIEKGLLTHINRPHLVARVWDHIRKAVASWL